jgi:CheY-like chemotaxis protein
MNGRELNQAKKILLVDNETDLTYALSSVLEDNDFLVDCYNDPVVVSNTYKPNYYDLVILDIKMPKMDGFQLYENLRKKDQKTKICFLTASEMFYESLRKARNIFGDALGEEYFIQKPIKTNQLVKKLNELIDSS